jgi:hypothetical protein
MLEYEPFAGAWSEMKFVLGVSLWCVLWRKAGHIYLDFGAGPWAGCSFVGCSVLGGVAFLCNGTGQLDSLVRVGVFVDCLQLLLEFFDFALELIALADSVVTLSAEVVLVVRVDHVDDLKLGDAGAQIGVGGHESIVSAGSIQRGWRWLIQVERRERRRTAETLIAQVDAVEDVLRGDIRIVHSWRARP